MKFNFLSSCEEIVARCSQVTGIAFESRHDGSSPSMSVRADPVTANFGCGPGRPFDKEGLGDLPGHDRHTNLG